MITINDIKRRIEYVEKILALYEGEKEALESLSKIYSNIAYQDVRALEELVKQNTPTGIIHREVVKQEPKPMNRSLSPVATMLESTSYKKLLKYIYNEENDGIVPITVDAPCAKEIGIGSNTLSKLRDMMMSTGRISKTTTKGFYKISDSLLEELTRLERYGM